MSQDDRTIGGIKVVQIPPLLLVPRRQKDDSVLVGSNTAKGVQVQRP